MDESQQVRPEVFRFEKEDDVLEGKLVSIRAGKFGNVYGLVTDKGRMTVFGTKVLDSRMKMGYLGKQIRIVYRGEVQGKSHPYKSFDVSLNDKEDE